MKFCTDVFTDVNECQTNNGGCQQICANADGSFNCECKAGFTLTSNNLTCEGTTIGIATG